MILPYMSIDLFFIAAPFLCRTEEELRIFSRRVIAAIIIAGVCFLLFPLRFAFPRPHANGWLGSVFDWFRGVDLPFNLFPSLHAALLLLLVDVYARNLRGVLLLAVMSWFFLIALSPLLTYQHHVIDIVGGFVLAGYCFYFFRYGLRFRDPTLLAGPAHSSIGFVKWMRRTISSHRFTPHSR